MLRVEYLVMTKEEVEIKLKAIKPYIAQKFNVNKIGYFGSYARGSATPKSDIDILVEFTSPLGWEFFDLEFFLESVLDMKVDLVTSKALKKQLRDNILSEVKYL